MLTRFFGYAALACVVASVVVGIATVWFDKWIPWVYAEKAFTTLSILMGGSVVAAIVSYFFIRKR